MDTVQSWNAAIPGRFATCAGHILRFHCLLQDSMRCLLKDDMKRQ